MKSAVAPAAQPSWAAPAPSNQPAPQPKTSHTMRNVGALIVIVVLVVAVLAVIGSMGGGGGGGGGGILPSQHTENIVNGVITVGANSYEDYQFTVPSGASSVSVSGSFTASGGSGNDIVVLVMDSADFVNWSNGHTANAYYNSGQETTGTISASLPAGATYYLVYSNTFSLLSTKNVQTTVNLIYTS